MADLWTALEVQGHNDGTLEPDLSMNEIMDTWTLHKGFPVLHVEKYDLPRGHVFQLRQEKFNLEIGCPQSIIVSIFRMPPDLLR